MTTASELLALVGVGLAGAAYVPQVWHLVAERYTAGLSRAAFSVWLVSSLLVTIHAVMITAVVFVVLGAVQMLATGLILFFSAKYDGRYCTSHHPLTLASRYEDEEMTAGRHEVAP